MDATYHRPETHAFRAQGLDPAGSALLDDLRAEREGEGAPEGAITAVSTDERSGNRLRPRTFDEIVGQERAKALMRRFVAKAQESGRPLSHTLLVGAGGTGKSTFSHVIAHELGVAVYDVEAPVSLDTLVALAGSMKDGDILRIEEVHQQAVGDRRGAQSSMKPEVLYGVMEDFALVTGTATIPFPRVTIIGTTTDEGLLPDSFVQRFPLKPMLDAYSDDDMTVLAFDNARRLNVQISHDAAVMFARAARRTPRVMNNYMSNAADLAERQHVDVTLAETVLFDLNGVSLDGLTRDMQGMLTFLYERCRRVSGDEVTYRGSVATIATAIGKSRDVKAIQLRVEPYLIECGFIQVGQGGRILTDAGVTRARLLIHERTP